MSVIAMPILKCLLRMSAKLSTYFASKLALISEPFHLQHVMASFPGLDLAYPFPADVITN
jgi:hypothetical protein